MSAPKGPSLLDCISALKNIFFAHAGADQKLDKTELKEMLKDILPPSGNEAMVNQMIKSLDMDGDSLLNFNEYLLFVMGLTCACNGQALQR